METLTEKDLKYYLGTGLKINCGHLYLIRELTHDYFDDARVCLTAVLRGNYRPLMLPLSALTEPLPDGSIPIDVIREFTLGYSDFISNERDHWINLYGIERWKGTIPFMICEYLYANHFWLGDQSYFEKGIIIDKRTVKL